MLKNLLSRAVIPSCLLLAGLFTAYPMQASPIPEFQAGYQLRRDSLKIGSAQTSYILEKDGHYLYESHSRPAAWLSWLLKDRLHELSRGIIDAEGIRPLFYRYKQTGGKRERHAELYFDWDTMSVENRVADSIWKMNIPRGTLDKLIIQLAMMRELGSGATEITFNIADGGKLKEYRFAIIGTETLDLPAGQFETVKVRRLRETTTRDTVLWCAPSLSYLPVRIWQREKDDTEYTSDLESYSPSLEIAD